MWLADTNFPSEKNFEVENFQLLTEWYFRKICLSVEIFRQWNGPLDFTVFSLSESVFYFWIVLQGKSNRAATT
jgi:hypothetical protein